MGGTGVLHVTVGTEGATKASLTGLDEKAIRSLQVFVFNAESGKRETDKFVSANSLTITAPVGNKHVWAIVNHSRFADMPTEADLKNTVTDLSVDPGSSGLWMRCLSAANGPGCHDSPPAL